MTREGIYTAAQPREPCGVLDPLRHAQPCEPVRRLDHPRRPRARHDPPPIRTPSRLHISVSAYKPRERV